MSESLFGLQLEQQIDWCVILRLFNVDTLHTYFYTNFYTPIFHAVTPILMLICIYN